MIVPAVAEFMQMFDYKGSFLFVERVRDQKPVIHIESCAEIKAKNNHFPTKVNASVLYASEILFTKPEMLAGMVRSIANDVSVNIVYAETEGLARFLAGEATKEEHLPYTSMQGRIMEQAMNNQKE